jgi:hypothetical protein
VPKTYLRTTYQYDELTKAAKAKAFEKLREMNDECFDSQHITDMFADFLTDQHFPADDIRWSLSCCQGDGVAFFGDISKEDLRFLMERCFTSTSPLDITKPVISKMIEEDVITISITSLSHRYTHYNTMSVDIEYHGDVSDAQVGIAETLVTFILNEARELSHKMEKMGYEEIAYMQSEETLTQEAIDSEREFNKDGTLASLKGCVEQ